MTISQNVTVTGVRLVPHLTITLTLPYPNLNALRSRLPSKSNGFFCGPRATFPPNFVKTHLVVFT